MIVVASVISSFVAALFFAGIVGRSDIRSSLSSLVFAAAVVCIVNMTTMGGGMRMY